MSTLVPSAQLRWEERLKRVPAAISGFVTMGGGSVCTPYLVLQQWWHHPHEGHNSATGLNGQWRDLPTVKCNSGADHDPQR